MKLKQNQRFFVLKIKVPRGLIWLNLYGFEAVRHKLKNRQKMRFLFLWCFWAYVGQSHNHISWAIPMPFASINSTNPRTNPWNFIEKILRIGRAWKWGIFEAAILNFLSQPFWIFFASSLWKIQPFYMRYHFFLHYGWFFQNLGKEAVRTFMHTTVYWKLIYPENNQLLLTLKHIGTFHQLHKFLGQYMWLQQRKQLLFELKKNDN